MDALASKNKRTISESLDELGFMANRLGSAVMKPDKVLPEIANCVGNPDSAIRTSALGAIAKFFNLIGEDVWKPLGGRDGLTKSRAKVGPKERDLILERLKRTKIDGVGRGAPSSPAQAAPPKLNLQSASVAAASQSRGALSSRGNQATPASAAKAKLGSITARALQSATPDSALTPSVNRVSSYSSGHTEPTSAMFDLELESMPLAEVNFWPSSGEIGLFFKQQIWF